MKRDMDLVRELLLTIERDGDPALRDVPAVDRHDNDTVTHHVKLMLEAGYVRAIDVSTVDGPDFMDVEMTWQGHELLETMRDSEVWKRTKAGAGKVGSWSVSLLAELGKAYVQDKARTLGLPI